MPIPAKTAVGVATVATADYGFGNVQGVAMMGMEQVPLGATFFAIGTVLATLAVPASSNLAVLRLEPGAAIRYSTAATANGSLGILLCAAASFPEELTIVGSTMLSKINFARNAGETVNGSAQIEFYRVLV